MTISRLPPSSIQPQPQIIVRPPPPPKPVPTVDRFERGPGGGSIGGGLGSVGKPAPTPALNDAKERLETLEANPPDRADYPGFFGQIAYNFAVARHASQVELAKKEVTYEQLKLTAPQRSSYASDAEYDAAHTAYEKKIAPYQEALGPTLLERYKDQAAAASPTSAKIIAAAEKAGVPVTVLSDEEYARRYPGTAGVTTSDGVFVPASQLEQPSGVLEHELMHGIFGRNEEVFDTGKSVDERIGKARELFESIGLDPDDGERLVRVTDGWGKSADSDHVQTYVNGVAIAREKAGLPPLSAAEKDELYAGVAEREAALGLQRGPLNDIASKPRDEQEELLKQAEAQWAKTPQGRANPPSGDSFEERLASLTAITDRLASEDRLLKFKP